MNRLVGLSGGFITCRCKCHISWLIASNGYNDFVFIYFRRNLYIGDIISGNRFHPNRLPDACCWRVPDVLGIEGLFSMRIWALVGGIINFDCNFVLSVLQCIGNIKGEFIIASRVCADFFAVDKYCCLPVDCTGGGGGGGGGRGG